MTRDTDLIEIVPGIIRPRGGFMNEVNIKKDKLIKILTKNRKTHKDLFDEALEGFHTKVGKAYDKIAAKATSKKGLALEDAKRLLQITEPRHSLDDYDQALEMLSLETRDTVPLTRHEFAQYVQDDWDWKPQFNAAYMATTGKFIG